MFFVSADCIGCGRQKLYLGQVSCKWSIFPSLHIRRECVWNGRKKSAGSYAPAAVAPGRKQFTQEELQREYDYIRAEKLTRKLLDLGLITIEGFDKIMALNRESFSPALARIMP